MNNFVSLLAPGGKATPAAEVSMFPGMSRRAESAPPFSAALDRAVHTPAARQDAPAKPKTTRGDRSETTREAGSRSEVRERFREKTKSKSRDEETSLAGACALTGQPVKLEEPQPSAVSAEKDCADEPISAVGGDAEAPSVVDDYELAAVADSGEEATAVLPRSELEALLEPLVSVAELTQAVEPAAAFSETVAPEPANLEVTPDLPEQSNARLASTIAAALGAEPTTKPANVIAPEALPTQRSAEAPQGVDPTTDEARRITRAIRRSLAEARENVDGTGAAKMSETMKTAIKKEEVAGLSQQMLPGSSPMPAAVLSNLPGEARLGAPVGLSAADALNAASKLSPAPARSDLSGAGESLELRPMTTITRINEVITREVRMFKRGGDDSVEVVLTPDSRTQISLRLQWREGQVEVQARCDLGDHQMLNQQWSQLQTAMAQHGVRLSHLSERASTGFTEFFNNPSFAQQHGGERRASANPVNMEAASPTVSQPGKAIAIKSGVRSSRLLESWA